ISRTVFSALSGMRLLACLIVAPQRGYDEPAILSYAISSFCPTSADGLQAIPRRVRVIMPHTFKSDLVQECYLRAAEARQIAKAATDPFTKADFVALERRWLSLARRYECEER